MTQAQTTPWGARVSATINHRPLLLGPPFFSPTPHPPALCVRVSLAQLDIAKGTEWGSLNHSGGSPHPPGLDSHLLETNFGKPGEAKRAYGGSNPQLLHVMGTGDAPKKAGIE